MTTYILKCKSYDNSIYWDMLLDDEYNSFLIYGNRHFSIQGDKEIERIYNIFQQYHGCDADYVEEFMDTCDVKINGNRTAFYKALNLHYEDESFCAVLSLITGKEWEHYELRGCCQGDWVDVVVPADTKLDLDYMEAVYFNTGYELGVIEDTDKKPDEIAASDVDYWDYTDKWRDEDIKEQMGLPDAVVLEEHKRTITVYSYS